MSNSLDGSSGFCSSSIWSGGAFLGKSSGESDSVAHLCLLLQERYRQDCNLAVQLLKCNKSHFRNHKFADVSSNPAEVGKKGSWALTAFCFLQLSLRGCCPLILQSQRWGEVLVPTPTEKAAQSFCQLLFHDSSISLFSQELL